MKERSVHAMLIRRQLDIILHLINSTEAIAGQKLATFFQVNVRTIRSDIKKINEVLNLYDISVKSSNRFGYMIEKEDIVHFHKKNILQLISNQDVYELPQSPNERISYLFFLLAGDIGYEVEELAELLYISVASIYQDIHIIKRFLHKRFKGLVLKNIYGKYTLIGSEDAKRNLLSGIVSQRYHHLLEQKYSDYINPDGSFLKTIYKVIQLMSIHKHTFPFLLSGEGLYSFASDVALCIEREMQGLLLTYKLSPLYSPFLEVKSFLYEHLEETHILNEKNWSYLQNRFYSKNFIQHTFVVKHDISNQLIENYQSYMQEFFSLYTLQDDKSKDYMIEFLDFFLANINQGYDWNEEDKYEIMISSINCYCSSLILSYLVYKETLKHFNTAYLSKCALVLKESLLRNEIKRKGVLITNKDKEHIMCLLHIIVKYFGNTIDLLEYGTQYDVLYGLMDIQNYDVVISTEALDSMNPKDYIKISSLCGENDINKISEYLKDITFQKNVYHYDILIEHIQQQYDSLEEFILDFIKCKKEIECYREIPWDVWELEELFYLKIDENSVFFITPFICAEQSKLYQLIPKVAISYKRHLFNDIKLFVFARKDFGLLDNMINQ